MAAAAASRVMLPHNAGRRGAHGREQQHIYGDGLRLHEQLSGASGTTKLMVLYMANQAHFITHLRRRPSVFRGSKITHSLSPPPLRRTTATATTMTIDRTICGGGGGGNVSLDGTRGAGSCAWD